MAGCWWAPRETPGSPSIVSVVREVERRVSSGPGRTEVPVTMMSLALIGLPQVGKKTLFELLTGLTPDKAPRRGVLAFGIAPVRDPRIDRLNEMYKPKKKRYAEFE